MRFGHCDIRDIDEHSLWHAATARAAAIAGEVSGELPFLDLHGDEIDNSVRLRKEFDLADFYVGLLLCRAWHRSVGIDEISCAIDELAQPLIIESE